MSELNADWVDCVTEVGIFNSSDSMGGKYVFFVKYNEDKMFL